MRPWLLCLFLGGAASAEARWIERCFDLLARHDGPKREVLAEARPWTGPVPALTVVGWAKDDVEREFLDALPAIAMLPFVGHDVVFPMFALQIVDDEDHARVTIANVPQRVLTPSDLPIGEQSALRRLLNRPPSRLRWGQGFRESLVAVGYVPPLGAVTTEVLDGTPCAIPRPLVDRALEHLEGEAVAAGRPLAGFTLVHVHPETHVPLTEEDVSLVDHLAWQWRRKLAPGSKIAIVAGSTGGDGVVFRYEASVGPRRQ